MPIIPGQQKCQVKPLKVLIIVMAHKPTFAPNVPEHKKWSSKKAWRLIPLLRINPQTKTKLLTKSRIFD